MTRPERREMGDRKSAQPGVAFVLLLLLPPVLARHAAVTSSATESANSGPTSSRSSRSEATGTPDSVSVRLSRRGLLELRATVGGVLLLETSRPARATSASSVNSTHAFSSSSSSSSLFTPPALRLLQVTDGAWLVQTVRKGRVIKDCRWSQQPHDVARFLRQFRRAAPARPDLGNVLAAYSRMSVSETAHDHRSPTFSFTRHSARLKFHRGVWMPLQSVGMLERFAAYLNVEEQVGECQDLLALARKQVEVMEDQPAPGEEMESPEHDSDDLSTQLTSPERTSWRNKRDLLSGWLIFPGTKWCGDGDIAEHDKDLGYDEALDSCCREHDRCPHVIPRLSWHYKLFNYYLHTISHCRCDRIFRKCLKSSPSPSAHMVGKIYFNVVGPQCFKFTKQKTCKRRNWWGRCKRYGDIKVAHPKTQKYF